MPRLTRVPERPVPPLPGWARLLVRPADLFMILMLSRPRSGSLSATWVTPATLLLCLVLFLAGLPVGWLLLASGAAQGGVIRLVAGGGLVLAALGAAAVALVGIAQRRA